MKDLVKKIKDNISSSIGSKNEMLEGEIICISRNNFSNINLCLSFENSPVIFKWNSW